MGVNNQRMDAAEMAAKRYSMSVSDMHIIVEIPVGAVGGYFKVSVGLLFCFRGTFISKVSGSSTFLSPFTTFIKMPSPNAYSLSG